MSAPTPGELAEKREEALELMTMLSQLSAWARARARGDVAHELNEAADDLSAAANIAAGASSAFRRAKKRVEE